MKRAIILIFFALSFLSLITLASAINLNIEKTSSQEVMVAGINRPATFDLKITNLGASDSFRFDNFLGFRMFPIGAVAIPSGKTEEIQLKVYPPENFQPRGFYNFQYQITASDLSSMKQDLTVKVIDLKDAFEIGSGNFNPESNSIEIYIQNKENFNFGDIKAVFSSPFFNVEKEFTLAENERKEFTVNVKKEDFKKLMAGFYTLNSEIKVDNISAKIEGTIKFSEKNILTTTSRDYGLIINTKLIKKTNEGNTVSNTKTTIKKNIISRLFTSFSPEPDVVNREGMSVYYIWDKDIKPGESLEIAVKTNWLFPLVIIGFIIAIVILSKQYSKTNLILKKKVSFVHAKGGEFALKVTIFVQAKKYIERINIIDSIPPLVKIYKRFGHEEPTRVDEKNKRIEWNIERLDAGESRVFSYIIYSKVGVLGKFALPPATAIFEKDGKIQESQSNRAFFISEQGTEKEKIEEEWIIVSNNTFKNQIIF